MDSDLVDFQAFAACPYDKTHAQNYSTLQSISSVRYCYTNLVTMLHKDNCQCATDNRGTWPSRPCLLLVPCRVRVRGLDLVPSLVPSLLATISFSLTAQNRN